MQAQDEARRAAAKQALRHLPDVGNAAEADAAWTVLPTWRRQPHEAVRGEA